MNKIEISEDYPTGFIAIFAGTCEDPEFPETNGRGNTPAEAVRNLIEQTDTCEIDCANHCISCNRWFHDIKSEDGCDHDKELPCSTRAANGDHHCHDWC